MNRLPYLRNVVLVAVAITVVYIAGQLSAGEDHESSSLTYTRVAVIDVGRLTTRAEVFRRGMLAINEKSTALQREYDGRCAELRRMTAELNNLENVDPKTVRKAEIELARERRDARALADENSREIKHMETDLFVEVHEQLQVTLEKYCKAKGIDLVLRTNSGRYGELTSENVQRNMTETVLYQRGIDITDEIIEMMNRDD